MLARTLWRSVLTMVVWSLPLLAGAEDFHVETDLYNDGSKTAASTDTTIFFAGRVYDFLTVHSGGDHTESLVTICDPQKGRIVLLDPERKMKVELERDRLVELSGSLRTWAAVQNDALLKFSAEPKFVETTGSKADETQFNSSQLSYRVVTFVPDSPEAAKQYREFTDDFARLNAVTNPGSLPPFPRLAVNEALGKRNALPREVELTIAAKKLFGKPIIRRTEHQFEWHVTPGDEEKIAKAGQFLAEFSKVSLDEYVRPSAAPPAK